ncbi:hypothetical protein AWC38_SpisGene22493 [Stylophora pistillata]|uniref:Tc1-like transposase DDE domain-containing protein n=1 Tax=Stylophora pistillata TaxID=50429 RepID=A0A2B4RAL5_STYPI|nr:hypothetical protein AWC38_SpisGene22493 [Stylophora pistillata]
MRGFEDKEEDYLVVVDSLGVNQSTARGIEARYIREGRIQERSHGGRNKVNHAVMCHCVFVDECGYNIWMARSHGKALQEQRAYRQVCGQHGQNLTVTMAIPPINGLVFSSAAVGEINATWFDNFLAQARTNPDLDEEVIFVYDRAPAH